MTKNTDLDKSARVELGHLVTKVFDAWGLPTEQRCKLLGISTDISAILGEFGSGKRPLPSKTDIVTRALHIITIYEILHCSCLKRTDLADSWPTRTSMEFNGEPPINSMWSLEGLARIRNKLELESGIQDYNAHIEQHGVFAADKKRF
jgi:hypothetical protein